jgi:hypothetical protein
LKELKEILNPQNILVDNRTESDFILLLKKFALAYNYYDRSNKPIGNFATLLESDESFLIAEISKFPIAQEDQKRLNLIARFDHSATTNLKEKVFLEYLLLTIRMFAQINTWYNASKKNNLSTKSSKIELTLEEAIQNKLANPYNQFKGYIEFFRDNNILSKSDALFTKDYDDIVWKKNKDFHFEAIFDYPNREELINNSLKKIILISTTVFETIYQLTTISQKILHASLYDNNNHKAHIGLLFAFLKLYDSLQSDINNFSTKHLDFYYKTILKQKELVKRPIKTFITLDIEENSNEFVLSNNHLLIAGQYEDGAVVKMKMEDDLRLNNVKIAELLTVFVSRNQVFDFNSKFQLVSSIYYKSIANSISDVSAFNANQTTFSTLGRDQNFLTATEMTMQYAEIGFMISSPIFRLEKSERKIKVDFNFSIASINYLADLILDIANNTELNEDEVFYRVFSEAFIISYTSEEGWHPVKDYEILSPEDWTTGTITLVINLTKRDPALYGYQKELHEFNLKTTHPLIQINLNQKNYYNSYSFLSTLELLKINIEVEVEKLRKLKIYREGQLVDSNTDFYLFGPLAKHGASLYIGCEELFNKKITSFGIDWDYTNIPPNCKDIQPYYAAYKPEFNNSSFKIRLSVLSDFKYQSSNEKEFEFNVFETDDDNELCSSRKIEFRKLDTLQIKPNFLINSNYLSDFSNDIETGLLRLELSEPFEGFGFDLYPKLQSNLIASQFDPKKKVNQKDLTVLNEPFSPQVNNIQLSYKAKTILAFNDENSFENDVEEDNVFYQISPFGVEKTFSKDGISDNTIYHNFDNEGELVIGLESNKLFTGLNVLFEIIKSENTNYEFSRQIDWYYSSVEGWKKLESDHILYDQTFNLMKTGIISFRFPEDFSRSQKLLHNNRFYLKAYSKNKADQFSLIKSIVTNANTVVEIIDSNNQNRLEQIKANTIEGFEKKINAIISVNQPFDSGPFKTKEEPIQFYQRVSELLRHKNRPVTKWDIERFILSRFDWLSHVICFHDPSADTKSNINVLCMKRIETFQNIEEVKLSMAEMNQINETVSQFMAPFAKISIVNPIFEDLWIKCKLRFKNIPIGKGIEQLNNDLLNFICAWKTTAHTNPHHIPNRIKKYDVIKFIRTREYIAFVTGISIVHFRQLADGSINSFDSALQTETSEFIESGTPWSIIVPRNNHKIKILTKDEYFPPEPTNFSDMGINSSFLIVKKQVQETIENNYSEERKEHNLNNLQFQIKL